MDPCISVITLRVHGLAGVAGSTWRSGGQPYGHPWQVARNPFWSIGSDGPISLSS